MVSKIVHLSGLNGIRAIAALAVVFAHTTLQLPKFNLDPSVFGYSQDGLVRGSHLAGFGVSIFFALSGFLITYLLLIEKETQPINVKHFYIRRILRIQPLYFLYLIICLFALALFQIDYPKTSLIFYIFFSANIPFIMGQEIPYLGHYWSLGVEEQFYIFYPLLAKYSKKFLRNLLVITLLLLIAKTICRLIDIKTGNALPYQIIHVTRFQCMLIGAIGANFFYKNNPIFLKIATNIFVQFSGWLAIFLSIFNSFHIASFLDNEIISVITVFLIIGQATKTNRLINLDNVICDFAGKISYGIYVIHPLVIFGLSYFLFDLNVFAPLKYIAVYLSVISLTMVLAYISFNYYEKVFLKLKFNYSAVKSSGSKDF